MQQFETRISMPPGVPSGELMREFFRLAFEKYRWFKPVRYGVALLNEQLDPEHADIDALVAFFEERKTITVTARTERDFLLIYPAKSDAPPHVGGITWCTSVTKAKKPRWREAHLRQVVEVMRLVNSPFAYASANEDGERKRQRWVPSPDGIGQVLTFTVRDPSEGLAGLFWRNFYGPPFTRMFGEKLASLPPGTRTELGNGIVLVQPYELPTQAGTPEGEARERELISLLGPECFYDHARHLKPTRVPELTPVQ